MNDRLPPQIQLWTWPTGLQTGQPVRTTEPVRIGDAERDQAVSTLGDHFAAGRLTRDEFDTRVDQAMAARFDGDLKPLFADLPRPVSIPAPVAAGAVPMRTAGPLLALWLMPFLLVSAVVTAVALGAPWMLWMFFWVAVMAPVWGRRPHPGHYHRR